jgi:hypothetical protein
MIVVGETGLVRWSCVRGELGPGDLEAFVGHIRGTRTRPGLVMVDITHDISAPTAAHRREIADAVRDCLAGTTGIAGHVVVSNSAVARGVLTAVNWMVKTPFPECVASSPEAGFAWAKKHSPDLDVDVVLKTIARQVPWFSALRW